MYSYKAKIYYDRDNISIEPSFWMHPCGMAIQTLANLERYRIVSFENEGKWLPFDGKFSVDPSRGASFIIEIYKKYRVNFQYYRKDKFGSIATISVNGVELENNIEDVTNSLIEMCMIVMPESSFAWIDHEIVIEEIEQHFDLARINALAWATVITRKLFATYEMETKKLIDEAPWHGVLQSKFHKEDEAPHYETYLTGPNPVNPPKQREFKLSEHFNYIPVRGLVKPRVKFSSMSNPVTPSYY